MQNFRFSLGVWICNNVTTDAPLGDLIIKNNIYFALIFDTVGSEMSKALIYFNMKIFILYYFERIRNIFWSKPYLLLSLYSAGIFQSFKHNLHLISSTLN